MQIFVTSNCNSGPGSLRHAFEKGARTIVIKPSIRKIHLEEEITIDSNTTLIGNKAKISSDGRIFRVNADQVNFQTLELSESRTHQDGGAIFSDNDTSTIILDRVLIKRNRAYGSGGGVYTKGNLTVLSSIITENWANVQGGGVWVGKKFSLIGSLIRKNLVSGDDGAGGAGAFVDDGDAYLDRSSIILNKAPKGSGGGISVMTGSIFMYDSQVDQNEALNSGGIQEGQGNVYLYRSSASNNRSTNDQTGSAGGGGITITLGSVYLDHSKICDNKTVGMYSGGIVSLVGDVNITKSKITGNENRGPGGGIALNVGQLYLNRSIVQGNTGASLGGGIVNFAPGSGLIMIRESRIQENTLTNAQTIPQTIKSFFDVIRGQLTQLQGQATKSGPGGGKLIEKIPEILEKIIRLEEELEKLKIEGNKIGGGGIATLLPTRLVLLRSLVQDNFAGKIVDEKNVPLTAAGGGIFAYQGPTIINESEIKHNRAKTTGGGIYNAGELVLRFSKITHNTAQNGGGVYTTQPFIETESTIVKNKPNNVAYLED